MTTLRLPSLNVTCNYQHSYVILGSVGRVNRTNSDLHVTSANIATYLHACKLNLRHVLISAHKHCHQFLLSQLVVKLPEWYVLVPGNKSWSEQC